MFLHCMQIEHEKSPSMYGNESTEGEKIMKKNVIVGQSGGPTAVINMPVWQVSTRQQRIWERDTIYGMRYGIQGLLEKKIVDLGGKRSATTWMWNF